MKKIFIILCAMTIQTIPAQETRVIALCPLQLLDTTDPIHDHSLTPTLTHALEQINIQDTLMLLSRIMQGVIVLSAQQGTPPQLYLRIAAIIASLMEETSETAAQQNFTGTDSLAQVYKYMHTTKRPRSDKDPATTQERQRIRDIILASCINILTNVAVITAHPHDHKLVGSQSTLIAANIINAVRETVRSPNTVNTNEI